jgi:hypothetical protein
MTEIGRIHPIKKAACPHCGQILEGEPGKQKNGTCPKCKRPISGPEAASSTPASIPSPAPMSFAAQMMKLHFQKRKDAQNTHKPEEENGE